jgi:hypothetical protein
MALSIPTKAQLKMREAAERRERRSGNWTPLQKRDLLDMAQYLSMVEATGATGWSTDATDVWTNEWLVVTVHSVPNSAMQHISYRTVLGAELGWKEKQRLKDEIFGPDRHGGDYLSRSLANPADDEIAALADAAGAATSLAG